MFSYINSFFKNDQPSKPKEDTWVFFWDMTGDDVGHAAMQIGGDKPKMTEEDPGTYISIHPGAFPSTGLTSVLPLKAHLANNLSEDMETLGAKPTRVGDMDTPINTSFEADQKPLPPSRVYKLKDLDTDAMRAQINSVQEKVETGEAAYQLFPNVNLARFFKESPAFIAQDPIDIEMYRRTSKRTSDKIYNCTSLVRQILDVGGMHLPHFKMPWDITPSGLADKIDKENNDSKFHMVTV